MPPTIIRFLDQQDAPGAVSFFLAKPNGNPAFRPLLADPDQPPYVVLRQDPCPEGSVATVGQALYQELLTNAAIANHFNGVFGNKSQNPPRPIGIQVDSARADSLPWETLLPPGGEYLSLDHRWPVVRVLDPDDDKLRQDYEYVTPLKIAAVLSAWGSTPGRQISAEDEWISLEQGILKNAAATETHLLILVCEDALKKKIDAAKHPHVQVELITGQSQISQSVKYFRPHILHFFCHGHSGEKSYLRINTAFDQAQDHDGSVFLRPADLRQEIDPDETAWLLVLNCCDSANAVQAGDTRNLAASLVRAGFPAVIGMRERIDGNYARVVTQEFYTDLLAGLEKLPYGQASAMEWAEILVRARKSLSNAGAGKDAGPNAADSSKQWTIPALYMRTLPFRMRKLQPKLSEEERQAIIGKLDGLREQRNSVLAMPLQAANKQEMLAAFDQIISAEEKKLL